MGVRPLHRYNSPRKYFITQLSFGKETVLYLNEDWAENRVILFRNTLSSLGKSAGECHAQENFYYCDRSRASNILFSNV